MHALDGYAWLRLATPASARSSARPPRLRRRSDDQPGALQTGGMRDSSAHDHVHGRPLAGDADAPPGRRRPRLARLLHGIAHPSCSEPLYEVLEKGLVQHDCFGSQPQRRRHRRRRGSGGSRCCRCCGRGGGQGGGQGQRATGAKLLGGGLESQGRGGPRRARQHAPAQRSAQRARQRARGSNAHGRRRGRARWRSGSALARGRCGIEAQLPCRAC
jgi:hypothetical protein